MRSFNWDGIEVRYQWWAPSSPPLIASAVQPFAFDTETRLIDDENPLDIPEVALAIASDGLYNYLIHPEDLGAFWRANHYQHCVLHNSPFDFWVMDKHFRKSGSPPQRTLWDLADLGKLHDTMILDQLIQLGTGYYRKDSKGNDGRITPANLGTLSEEYTSWKLDKADPYRIRYGELIGLSKEEIEGHPEFTGFASYAIKDVIATRAIYPPLRAKAIGLMVENGFKQGTGVKSYDIRPDALEKFGPLTEAIQVRAAIALAELSRQPIKVDQSARTRLAVTYQLKVDEAVKVMDSLAPGLFKRGKEGQLVANPKKGLPSLSNNALIAKLEEECKGLNLLPIRSEGKLKKVSTSAKAWKEYANLSPFIKAWVEVAHTSNLMGFVKSLDAPYVYSRYDLLKATGRTSANKWAKLPGMNFQQAPREDAFRALFIAEEGHKLVSCDYAYLELRTLAATCQAKFGYSQLGEVIREHTSGGKVDPHQRTAASMLSLSVDDFLSLPKETQKKARQGAKAVNFGFPGGLGIVRFTDYAKAQYGVVVSVKEAKRHKRAWLEAYPEMRAYLGDVTSRALANNLRLPLKEIERTFSPQTLWDLREAISGDWKEDEELTQEQWERYQALFQLAKKKAEFKLKSNYYIWRMWEQGPSHELADWLFSSPAVTLTGRVRAGCGYTDGKNTPFQGLASDGGKEALWQLMYLGFKVRAFIHDELVVEVKEGVAEREANRIKGVMCKAMERVCGHSIPVACEATIAREWRH